MLPEDLSKLSEDQLRHLLTFLKGERYDLSYSTPGGIKNQLLSISYKLNKVRDEIRKRKNSEIKKSL